MSWISSSLIKKNISQNGVSKSISISIGAEFSDKEMSFLSHILSVIAFHGEEEREYVINLPFEELSQRSNLSIFDAEQVLRRLLTRQVRKARNNGEVIYSPLLSKASITEEKIVVNIDGSNYKYLTSIIWI